VLYLSEAVNAVQAQDSEATAAAEEASTAGRRADEVATVPLRTWPYRGYESPRLAASRGLPCSGRRSPQRRREPRPGVNGERQQHAVTVGGVAYGYAGVRRDLDARPALRAGIAGSSPVHSSPAFLITASDSLAL
jgi:hypothetical protein